MEAHHDSRRNKRNRRGQDIAMISVNPNYTGEESGLWVTEQHWAPVQIKNLRRKVHREKKKPASFLLQMV